MAETSHQKPSLTERVSLLDWHRIEKELDTRGFALTGPLLEVPECKSLVQNYEEEALYRSHIKMARHGFGRGEYKYYQYPLPGLVSDLRAAIYSHLVPTANRWAEALRLETRYPQQLKAYTERCHAAGQVRPTPLILKYGAGDFNRLHQDLYGEHVFPLQIAVLLSEPGAQFSGGEFVITEQRPRMQSHPHVVPLRAGEGVIFSVNERPVLGSRGYYRAKMRHGVSEVRTGERHTLGVIFHDAL